ncbi:MAG: lambda exonuclease family protein, partial [Armatimonadia bacterium]
EKFSNAAMQWGTEKEPDARAAYEFRTDAEVTQVGFVAHPSIPMTGASPDGMVGDVGLIEIKCPNTATHLDTLLSRTVPGKYITQMQWQMACAGRQWCDFVSYDPRLPESMRVFVQRVPRDADLISSLEKEVADFLSELDAKLAQLVATYERREAA